MKSIGYEIRDITIDEVRALCELHHSYRSAGGASVYAFGVFEAGVLVAAYAWQPPPPGAARAVCPEAPQGVLALSRMVAVPAKERQLNHVSKPLRRQMRTMIDRTRWPVLLTYSDEGQGHTGHVYKCSGWKKTVKAARHFFLDEDGNRASSYSNGKHGGRVLTKGGITVIQRWEHWACPRGEALTWMVTHGWRREPVPGKVWRSGNQAYTYAKSRLAVNRISMESIPSHMSKVYATVLDNRNRVVKVEVIGWRRGYFWIKVLSKCSLGKRVIHTIYPGETLVWEPDWLGQWQDVKWWRFVGNERC